MMLIVAKWECPICGAIGRKWIPGRTCRKNGRNHIKTFHNKNVEPIIHKMKLPNHVKTYEDLR